jgi:WD40 repeat protein
LNLLEGAGAGTTEAGAATAAFSHDGRLLAVGYRDGWVRLWDFQKQRLITEMKEHDENHFGIGVSLSEDGHWLASVAVGMSPEVALFDLSDPRRPRRALKEKTHSGNTWSAVFPSDCRSLVTSGSDGLIKFWNLEMLKGDAKSRAEIALTLEHNPGLAVFVTFSSDGNLLVSQGVNGMTKLWPASP